MLYSNEKNVVDKRVREYIIPKKIIKTYGNVENADYLLAGNSNQRFCLIIIKLRD